MSTYAVDTGMLNSSATKETDSWRAQYRIMM